MTARSSTGYLGPKLTLTGRLSGEGDMEVDGRFEGELTLRGTLTVGAQGVVRGPCRVHSAEVAGALKGDLAAQESVTVREGGRLDGDVWAARVAIDDGGVLSGGIHMDFEVPDPGEGRS